MWPAAENLFLHERLIQDAAIRNFKIIGEAAGRLSAELRSRENVPWGRIIAFPTD
jgi:uncharacterized protein with HEPN domain